MKISQPGHKCNGTVLSMGPMLLRFDVEAEKYDTEQYCAENVRQSFHLVKSSWVQFWENAGLRRKN